MPFLARNVRRALSRALARSERQLAGFRNEVKQNHKRLKRKHRKLIKGPFTERGWEDFDASTASLDGYGETPWHVYSDFRHIQPYRTLRIEAPNRIKLPFDLAGNFYLHVEFRHQGVQKIEKIEYLPTGEMSDKGSRVIKFRCNRPEPCVVFRVADSQGKYLFHGKVLGRDLFKRSFSGLILSSTKDEKLPLSVPVSLELLRELPPVTVRYCVNGQTYEEVEGFTCILSGNVFPSLNALLSYHEDMHPQLAFRPQINSIEDYPRHVTLNIVVLPEFDVSDLSENHILAAPSCPITISPKILELAQLDARETLDGAAKPAWTGIFSWSDDE